MQQHVHAANAQHGVVKVVAVEHAVVKVRVLRRHAQHVGVGGAQVFACGHQKAAGAAGRVANGVLRHRGGQGDHQINDVARGAELAVLPGGGNLAEHVFVQVALGVAVVERNGVEQIDHARQQCGRGDGEAGVTHVVRKGALRAAICLRRAVQAAQEREDMLAQHGEHFSRRHVLEARPAQLVKRPAPCVLAFGVQAHGLGFQALGFVVFTRLVAVEAAQKQQVGDLLDDFQRVGDAARPEGVPDLVDFVAQFTGQHGDGGRGQRSVVGDMSVSLSRPTVD